MSVINTECVRILEGHRGAVLNVKFTLNGSYCLSTSQDKTIILWNPIKGLVIKKYQGPHNHEINDVSISNDNSKFVSCGGDQSAFQWDVTTGNVIRKFAGHEGKINCCEIAADNGILLTGSYDKCVRLWDLKSPSGYKPVQILKEAKDAISSIMVTDDKRILTTSVDGSFRIYDIRAGQLHTDKLPSPAVRAGLSHDERCITINCLDSSIHLLEIDSGQHLNVYKGHKNSNYSINSEFDITDNFVVSGSEDGRIVVWDICGKGTELIQELQPHNTTTDTSSATTSATTSATSSATSATSDWGCVFTVRFHPVQRLLLSCHNDKTIRVWKQNEK